MFWPFWPIDREFVYFWYIIGTELYSTDNNIKIKFVLFGNVWFRG
jgi:hypothetical protein